MGGRGRAGGAVQRSLTKQDEPCYERLCEERLPGLTWKCELTAEDDSKQTFWFGCQESSEARERAHYSASRDANCNTLFGGGVGGVGGAGVLYNRKKSIFTG